ncbi:MAG: SCO family protein [Deltaproteobacteria bacterium]|nr:SCO family protein [Deltaproteobacteria bacterium]
MEKYPRGYVRDELWMNTTEMKDRIRHLRQLLWALCVIGLAGLIGSALWNGFDAGLRYSARPEKALEGLGNFGTVPDFSLLERSGISINLSDLQGKIWIVNFIYTSCPDTCPLQSAEMAKLQGERDHEATFRLLSITIDPERDTLQVLSRYANRFGADPDRWLFLTGEKEGIYRLAQQGFHLSAVPVSNDEGKNDPAFIHSSRFVLVDDKAEIRGYYVSTDPDALRRLRRDLKTLLTVNGQ